MKLFEKLLLITNDDGIDAAGLKTLVNAIKTLGKVIVVAPSIQRSAGGKSVTYSSPLRLNKVENHFTPEILAYSLDGTPADCVIMGLYLCKKKFGQRPDLIASGINSGDNTSVQSILTSGTCAAAFEGAIVGITSIAFSLEAPVTELFSKPNNTVSNFADAANHALKITRHVLQSSLPNRIKFLNVNFPSSVNIDTPIDIVQLCPIKYIDEAIVQKDPRGVPIYWIWGDIVSNLPQDTDSHSLLIKKHITITPIGLGFDQELLSSFKDFFMK
ncbi:MAG: 5'/3'-nucleotidase SurE [Candidatus Hodarchaeota archaeon]